MTGVDPEALSRFIDRESSHEEQSRLQNDDEAGAAASRLRSQDDLLREWFDQKLDELPPAALEKSIRTGFAARRARGGFSRWWAPAATAVVILIAGVVGFDHMIDRRVSGAFEQMRAERMADMALVTSAMQQALETQPSGSELHFENVSTGFEVTLTPRRTWRSSTGHWCREFVERFADTPPGSAPISTGCRSDDGQWYRVRTELPTPSEPFIPGRKTDL